MLTADGALTSVRDRITRDFRALARAWRDGSITPSSLREGLGPRRSGENDCVATLRDTEAVREPLTMWPKLDAWCKLRATTRGLGEDFLVIPVTEPDVGVVLYVPVELEAEVKSSSTSFRETVDVSLICD